MGADRDVVWRLSNEVFVDGDLSHWDDLVDDGFVDHDPMAGMSTTRRDNGSSRRWSWPRSRTGS